jgi:hypothetical protein
MHISYNTEQQSKTARRREKESSKTCERKLRTRLYFLEHLISSITLHNISSGKRKEKIAYTLRERGITATHLH